MPIGAGICCCDRCPTIPEDDIEGAAYTLTVDGLAIGPSGPDCRGFLCGFLNGDWDGTDVNRPPLTFWTETADYYIYRGISGEIPYFPQGAAPCAGGGTVSAFIHFRKPGAEPVGMVCAAVSPTDFVDVRISLLVDADGDVFNIGFSCYADDFPEWTPCDTGGAGALCDRTLATVSNVVRVA